MKIPFNSNDFNLMKSKIVRMTTTIIVHQMKIFSSNKTHANDDVFYLSNVCAEHFIVFGRRQHRKSSIAPLHSRKLTEKICLWRTKSSRNFLNEQSHCLCRRVCLRVCDDDFPKLAKSRKLTATTDKWISCITQQFPVVGIVQKVHFVSTVTIKCKQSYNVVIVWVLRRLRMQNFRS